jgi:hypothetical protein
VANDPNLPRGGYSVSGSREDRRLLLIWNKNLWEIGSHFTNHSHVSMKIVNPLARVSVSFAEMFKELLTEGSVYLTKEVEDEAF